MAGKTEKGKRKKKKKKKRESRKKPVERPVEESTEKLDRDDSTAGAGERQAGVEAVEKEAGAGEGMVEPHREDETPEPPLETVTAPDEDDEGGRLKKGMKRSRSLLTRPFVKAATRRAIDSEFWSNAEEVLIAADTGMSCAEEIVEKTRKRVLSEGVRDIEGLKQAFRTQIAETINSFGRPSTPPRQKPRVLFIVGVNGVGKTTTAAKLGYRYMEEGRSILFAAADTFRAAGIEQMEMWAKRVGAPVVRHRTGGDPGAVVFDAVESARAKDIELVIVDTAGRLHTKKNLMEELRKMWRVADRQIEGSPEAMLVIDATTGQNGISQAEIFNQAMDIGSIALTKMDGSAKGGIVMAIGRELGIPVAYIGVGEGMDDLRPFDPDRYAEALI